MLPAHGVTWSHNEQASNLCDARAEEIDIARVGQLVADLMCTERPGPTFDDTGLQLEQLLADRVRF
jgi:hypothetical protein